MTTRIAYVCADAGVPVFGRKGCSIHVQEVIRSLRGCGVEVELFATRLGGVAPPGLEEVRVHELPVPPAGEPAVREQAALMANDTLRGRLVDAGSFDVVYERYSLWSHAAQEQARAWGIPGLLEVNAPLIEEQATHRGLVGVDAAKASTARAFGAATALLPVSEEVAAYLQGWAEPGRIHVVPNGVEVGRFAGAHVARGGRMPGPVTIGFVGTLKPWHGTEVLLRAFAAARQRDESLRLRIVGDGPERASLAKLAEGLGLGGVVEFTGSVDHEAVPAELARLDIAVAPYPRLDGFYFSPLKVYEYMAAGLAVVASEVGQLGRVLTHDRDAWLVEPGNVAALTDALLALAADRDRRQRLGDAARALVEHGHTWRAVAGRILGLAGVMGPEGASRGGRRCV